MTEQSARTQFLRTIKQMEGAAILLREKNDGRFETIFVSKNFARLMQCTTDYAIKNLNERSVVVFTHPDDRLAVRRMLRRRVSEESSKELTVRHVTAKGNVVWCNINYTFIDDFGEHYVYCTFADVTAVKIYAQRLQKTYMTIGDNFYRANERTLSMFRANLTRNKVEDMQGRDLFWTDSVIRPYSELINLRSTNYPIEEERLSTRKISRRDSNAVKRNFLCIYFHGARTGIIATLIIVRSSRATRLPTS